MGMMPCACPGDICMHPGSTICRRSSGETLVTTPTGVHVIRQTVREHPNYHREDLPLPPFAGKGRPDRDQTGLALALIWGRRGTCARRKVGCVLFDVEGFQIGEGYNGPAAGEPHCIDHLCPGAQLPSGTGLDACEALHAEWNALSRCRDVRSIHTCYVSSSPCMTCCKMLMNTGCTRIVFAERYAHDQPARDLWRRSRPGREWIHLPMELPT